MCAGSPTRSFRTFVVVNPNSANGRTARDWPAMHRALKEALGETGFDFALTEGPGEATELTRAALRDGAEMVVSVGGDGTNNEIINGFFDADGAAVRPDAVFGLLPKGTGGDFRKTVGLSTDFREAAAALVGRDTAPLDVGRATFLDHDGAERTRFFVNITSFGIGGLVDHYVNNSSKRLGGKVSFFWAATRALFTYRNRAVRLQLDDQEPRDLLINNVAVANGRFFGGGMQVAPLAELDDGLFDVVTFGDLTKLQYLRLAGSIYEGAHLEREHISHATARRVVATSDETVLIDMDGEQPGRLPITLEVVPAAVRLKVAAGAD